LPSPTRLARLLVALCSPVLSVVRPSPPASVGGIRQKEKILSLDISLCELLGILCRKVLSSIVGDALLVLLEVDPNGGVYPGKSHNERGGAALGTSDFGDPLARRDMTGLAGGVPETKAGVDPAHYVRIAQEQEPWHVGFGTSLWLSCLFRRYRVSRPFNSPKSMRLRPQCIVSLRGGENSRRHPPSLPASEVAAVTFLNMEKSPLVLFAPLLSANTNWTRRALTSTSSCLRRLGRDSSKSAQWCSAVCQGCIYDAAPRGLMMDGGIQHRHRGRPESAVRRLMTDVTRALKCFKTTVSSGVPRLCHITDFTLRRWITSTGRGPSGATKLQEDAMQAKWT